MAKQDNVLRIIGSKGRIEVADFWFASGHEGGTGRIELLRNDGTSETIEIKEDRWLYSFEVDAAGEAIRAGRREFTAPGMSWSDSIANLRVMDQWRAAVGLEYEIEKAARTSTYLIGEPVKAGTSVPSEHSRPRQAGLRRGARLRVLFPFRRCIADDGPLLAGGRQCVRYRLYLRKGQDRGDLRRLAYEPQDLREDIVLIGKGVHSPLCYPDQIGKQLSELLERLKTDYVDVYFMHRDNEDIPVGEFVDAMDAEVRAGRIRGPFGGSNWSRKRLAEGLRYAEASGRTAPSAMSNNFSLAEMISPVWDGCVAASDDDWKTWLKSHQVTNFAWSSQGR